MDGFVQSRMIKEMKKYNGENFLSDFKKCRNIMVYAHDTGNYFDVKKGDLKNLAAQRAIKYYITDKIFVVKRWTMVVQ